MKEGGISILFEFCGQASSSSAIKFLVCHTRNKDTLLFMQREVSFVQRLERFKCPRESGSLRYYMLTLFLVRTSSVWWQYFIFLPRSANCSLLVAFLMLDTQRWGRAKMMLMLWPHCQLFKYVIEKKKLFPASFNSRPGGPRSRWLGVTLRRLERWRSAVVLDRLHREFSNIRASQLPYLNPVSLESVFF